jgi:hypothetical protein
VSGNLQTYSLAFVTVNGPLLSQEQDVTITRTTNAVPVSTVVIGYAGDSPGAPMAEIDVQNAVPAIGFEFDPSKWMASLTPVQLIILGPGGLALKFVAQIYSDTFGHGVNKAASLSFKARSAFQLWS